MIHLIYFCLTFTTAFSVYMFSSKASPLSMGLKNISEKFSDFLDLDGSRARKNDPVLKDFFNFPANEKETQEEVGEISYYNALEAPQYAVPQRLASFTNYPPRWYNEMDQNHILGPLNRAEHEKSDPHINAQNFWAAGVAAVDIGINYINKYIGDLIKMRQSDAANNASILSMAACIARYYSATHFRDQSQTQAFGDYTDKYRQVVIGENKDISPSNMIENVDQAIFTRLAYHSQLWAALIGALVSFLSAIYSGCHLGIMGIFTCVTAIKIWFTNLINDKSMQISDWHTKVESKLRDKLKKPAEGLTATAEHPKLFEHYRQLYINRVTFESIVSFVGKAIDAFTKFLFLRFMLRVLLRGKFAYTALLPTYKIMTDYCKNINIAERTRKAVNPHRSAVNNLSSTEKSDVATSRKEKREEEKPETFGLWGGFCKNVQQLTKLHTSTILTSIILVAFFAFVQYQQSYFMFESIRCLNEFVVAIANRQTAMSLTLTWEILKFDILEQVMKVMQRMLVRIIQSNWAYELRIKKFESMRDSDTKQALGNLVIDDIKTATDGVMSVIEGTTKLSFDLWFCWASLYTIPHGPYIMLGLFSFTCIKYFVLKSQNRVQTTKERASQRDAVKSNMNEGNYDNLSIYKEAAQADIQSESQYGNLAQALTAWFKQAQVLIFSYTAKLGYITTQSFPGTLRSADVFCDATDEICKRLSDLQKMEVAAGRLNTAAYFDDQPATLAAS